MKGEGEKKSWSLTLIDLELGAHLPRGMGGDMWRGCCNGEGVVTFIELTFEWRGEVSEV